MKKAFNGDIVFTDKSNIPESWHCFQIIFVYDWLSFAVNLN